MSNKNAVDHLLIKDNSLLLNQVESHFYLYIVYEMNKEVTINDACMNKYYYYSYYIYYYYCMLLLYVSYDRKYELFTAVFYVMNIMKYT